MTGWIGGPRFDRAWFFGAALLAGAAGALMLVWPATVAPLWWAWLLLIDGPHLMFTYTRTYLDPAERRAQPRLLWGSLVWVLPGFLALAASRASGAGEPFDLFLLVATLWGWHHNLRQSYGLMAIYARHGGTPARWARRDGQLLHAAMWVMFALFLLMHPRNRAVLGLPVEIGAAVQGAGVAAAIVLAAGVLAYAVVRLQATRGAARRALWFLLGPVLATQAFALFAIGAAEPLFPAPANPEQSFLAVAVVGGMVHGLHYIGIVLAANRRRHAGNTRTLVAGMARRPLLAWGILAGLSLAYLAVNAARGTAPVVAWYPQDSDAARAFAALYWGLFFHHYYLDQRIWHPGRDRRLRVELGLETA